MKDRRLRYTVHAQDMLTERGIAEEWVERAVSVPDRVEEGEQDIVHYLKGITEHDDRVLRVVVNRHTLPWTVVIVFFDRRLGRTK